MECTFFNLNPSSNPACRHIPLVLTKNDRLFSRNYLGTADQSRFLHGQIEHVPESHARLYKTTDDELEGTIFINKELGTLHVEASRKYGSDGQIVYHSTDVKNPIHKRSVDENVKLLTDIQGSLNHLVESSRVHATYYNGGSSPRESARAVVREPEVKDAETPRKTKPLQENSGSLYPKDDLDSAEETEDGTEPKRRKIERATMNYENYGSTFYLDPSSYDPNYYTTSEDSSSSGYTDTSSGYTDSASSGYSENICNIALIADPSYYAIHGENTESEMISHASDVSYYLSTQVGLSLGIAYSHVITDAHSDYTGLGNIPTDSNEVVNYLNKVIPNLPEMDVKKMCLIATFTSQELSESAAGVAYVGTVCQKGGQGFVITDKSNSLSRSCFSSVLLHEIGHTLGASHDDEKCSSEGSKYVMFPTVQESNLMFTFSQCSLSSIQENLKKPESQCYLPPTRQRNGFRQKQVKNPTLIIG